MRRCQRGLTTVEFAIVGPVALMVLIGCIEVGRMLFVWNTVAEATRRGARVAAVVATTNVDAVKAAVLTYGKFLPGLAAGNVTVSHLNVAGAPTTLPADVRFVRVEVSGYTHSLLVPFVGQSVPVPPFATTLPAESLGIEPDAG